MISPPEFEFSDVLGKHRVVLVLYLISENQTSIFVQVEIIIFCSEQYQLKAIRFKDSGNCFNRSADWLAVMPLDV